MRNNLNKEDDSYYVLPSNPYRDIDCLTKQVAEEGKQGDIPLCWTLTWGHTLLSLDPEICLRLSLVAGITQYACVHAYAHMCMNSCAFEDIFSVLLCV